MKSLLLTILCCLSMVSCRNSDKHFTIEVNNNSNQGIYVIGSRCFPDTACFVYEGRGYDKQPGLYKIEPNSSNTNALFLNTSYESVFLRGPEPIDTLMIYIFDAKVMESLSWDSIGKYYNVLQRYDLSLDDLKSLNWKLAYPPTVAMKDIKMYPPYKE